MAIGTMTPHQWIIEGDTGVSSKTIWAVMMGVVTEERKCGARDYDTPHDPDDFKRCHKLIVLIPGWRNRLSEVAAIFPKWIPFIREWLKLEAMLSVWEVNVDKYWDLPTKERRRFKFSDGMYEFMQELDTEAMILDGWIQDSPGSWHREKCKQ